jgi:hypothetical protein
MLRPKVFVFVYRPTCKRGGLIEVCVNLRIAIGLFALAMAGTVQIRIVRLGRITGDLPNERMKRLQTKAGSASLNNTNILLVCIVNELELFVQLLYE